MQNGFSPTPLPWRMYIYPGIQFVGFILLIVACITNGWAFFGDLDIDLGLFKICFKFCQNIDEDTLKALAHSSESFVEMYNTVRSGVIMSVVTSFLAFIINVVYLVREWAGALSWDALLYAGLVCSILTGVLTTGFCGIYWGFSDQLKTNQLSNVTLNDMLPASITPTPASLGFSFYLAFIGGLIMLMCGLCILFDRPKHKPKAKPEPMRKPPKPTIPDPAPVPEPAPVPVEPVPAAPAPGPPVKQKPLEEPRSRSRSIDSAVDDNTDDDTPPRNKAGKKQPKRPIKRHESSDQSETTSPQQPNRGPSFGTQPTRGPSFGNQPPAYGRQVDPQQPLRIVVAGQNPPHHHQHHHHRRHHH